MLKKLNINFISIVFLINILFAGAFFEYVSCITSILLIGYLFYIFKKNGKLVFRKNISITAIGIIILFYALSAFWAIDAGMAVVGFFKFLPLLLYALVLMQGEGKDSLKYLPHCMSIITVITATLMQFDLFKGVLTVAGRLSGTFQYPNTFAIVLLISQLMLLKKEKRTVIDYICMLILFSGILISGSRTVFVFTVIFNIVLFLFNKNKKEKIVFFSCLFGAVAVFVIFCLVSQRTALLTRYFSISVLESSFLGRLLYYSDAIPLLLKNPFGMGYLGYNYVQGTVQTGLYAVMYVHNDFMQIFLDAGWIAGILFIIMTVKNIIKNKNRAYILALALHFLLDFSMQFVFVALLFLSFIDFEDGKQKTLLSNNTITYAVGTVATLACLYMGISFALPYLGQNNLAYKMNPYNTQIAINEMRTQTDVNIANEVAQNIISNNKYEINSYEIAAKYAASKGDITNLIAYKRKSIELNRYNYDLDIQYCKMLIECMNKYQLAGDSASYNVCFEELKSTVSRIQNSKNSLSKLGSMIVDQPRTDVPDEILKYVQ